MVVPDSSPPSLCSGVRRTPQRLKFSVRIFFPSGCHDASWGCGKLHTLATGEKGTRRAVRAGGLTLVLRDTRKELYPL
jgi:hypothetical protein